MTFLLSDKCFLFGSQILDPQDVGVLIVNDKCLKAIVTNEIESGLIEFINLVDPVDCDQWIGPCLAKEVNLVLIEGNPILIGEFQCFYFILFYFFPFCSRFIYVLDVALYLVLAFVVSDGFKGLFEDGFLDVITSEFLMLEVVLLFSPSFSLVLFSTLSTM